MGVLFRYFVFWDLTVFVFVLLFVSPLCEINKQQNKNKDSQIYVEMLADTIIKACICCTRVNKLL